MKEFHAERFRKDLIQLRGAETQRSFAGKLGIDKSTLSILENGKQLPTTEVLNRVCSLSEKGTEEYFGESGSDSFACLMRSLDVTDQVLFEEMAERIRIKEKYAWLAKRSRT